MLYMCLRIWAKYLHSHGHLKPTTANFFNSFALFFNCTDRHGAT